MSEHLVDNTVHGLLSKIWAVYEDNMVYNISTPVHQLQSCQAVFFTGEVGEKGLVKPW